MNPKASAKLARSSLPRLAASLAMSALNPSRSSHVSVATPSYGASCPSGTRVTRATVYPFRRSYPSRAIGAWFSSQYRPNSSELRPSFFRIQMCAFVISRLLCDGRGIVCRPGAPNRARVHTPDMYCSSCGLKQPAEHRFCPSCGARLAWNLAMRAPKVTQWFWTIPVTPEDPGQAALRVSCYLEEFEIESEGSSVRIPRDHVRFSVWGD